MSKKIPLKKILLMSSIMSVGFVCASPSQAVFEWTPPTQEMKASEQEMTQEPQATEVAPAPVQTQQQLETTDAPMADDVLSKMPGEEVMAPPPEETLSAPVEYIEDEAPKKEMILSVPVKDDVASDLQEIVQEANDNNVITPVAEIPETEKIDLPAVDPQPEVAPSEIAPPPVAEATPEPVNQDIVRGFGNDLPLIMAVRQIVPAGTAYSFGEKVDLSVPVSWEGGQTWQATIQNIATANGLAVSYDGQNVRLVRPGVPATKQAPAMVEYVDPQETEAGESVPEIVELPADVQKSVTTDVAAVEEPAAAPAVKNENEVLEATLSDIVVVSPVEDIAAAPAPATGTDVLNMEEGTVIGRIDDDAPVAPTAVASAAPAVNDSEVVVVAEEAPTMPNFDVLEDAVMQTAQDEQPDVATEPADIVAVEETVIQTPSISPDEMELAQDTTEDDIAVAAEEEAITIIEENVSIPEEEAPLDITNDTMAQDIAVANIQEPVELIETAPEVMDLPEEKAVPEKAIPAMMTEVKTWKVKKNSDLRTVLERWSTESGVRLQWNVERDYNVNYMVWVDGSFEEAVRTLMQGYSNEKGIIPQATLDMNAAEGPVLVIDPAV